MINTLRKPGLATRELADRVADILRGHPRIQKLFLFGSVARDGFGEDLDLIIIASDETASRFREIIDIRCGDLPKSVRGLGADLYIMKRLRFDAADLALQWDIPDVIEMYEAATEADPVRLDVFVFPPDWKDRLEELQTAVPHKDPKFMENIARDAIELHWRI